MSSMLNPVGPEEPSVYWRRRAIIVVALLVVLWLAWWLFSAVFGSDDGPDGQAPPPTGVSSSPPTSATSPAAVSPSSASPKPQAQAPTPKPSTSAKEKAKAASSKPSRCSDGALTVVVKPAERTAEVGSGLKVTMTVTNDGSETCRRDVGDAANEIQVVSGRVLVWSSNFCKGTQDGESENAGIVTLKPDQSWSTTVRWPGKVTLSSCPETQPTAKAGTYRALGTNGDKRSAESTFTLS